MSKKQMRNRKYKKTQRPRRRKGFKRFSLLIFLFCALAGVDYYDAGNLNRTLEVFESIGEYLKELPEQTKGLEEKAKSLTEQILHGRVENYTSLE